MIDLHTNILHVEQEARVALRTFDKLSHSTSRTLFIIDSNKRMVGSLTDGDIRRGLLNGLEISQPISFYMNSDFKFILDSEKNNFKLIKSLRQREIFLIPVLDSEKRITQILDLRKIHTMLPVSALIMAGGRGERLKPFTDNIPKPMLIIGDKPIIEHNIDRLIKYGVKQIFISVKYLKDQLMDYFGDGSSKGISIKYIQEDEPLGTLGCLSLINEIENDDIIVMNSDILTNIDFEDFFEFYKESNSKMVVASVPYIVKIPYAVLETEHNNVKSFVEKPTYTYYSNGGIYILDFGLKNYMEYNAFYNATDLMDRLLLEASSSLSHYPLLCYWLDIGKQQDYIKAQEDIKHLNF